MGKEITIPTFGTIYQKSNVGSLGYDRSKKDADFDALYANPDYIRFTNEIYEALKNNSDIGKEYTKAFHKARAKAYASDYDNNGQYIIKTPKGIFNADGSINADLWKEQRTNRKWGLVHEMGFKQDPTQNTTVAHTPDTDKQEDPQTATSSSYTNPFDAISDTPLTFNKPEHIPWTDWIPHTMQLMNARIANNKLARLQKQMSFPKQVAPQKNAIVTDAYAQRQLLEKQKQELLARADATQVANIDQKMAIMRQAEEQASKYNDAQVQLQSQEYAQTKKDVNDIENWNLIQRAEAADHNAKVNSAAYNNWLNAEKQKVTSDSAARKSYLYDMYKDYGLYKQDQRLNERANKEAQLKLDLTNKLSELENIFQDKSDPSRWEMLSQYAVEFVNSGALTDAAERAIVGNQALSPDAVKQKLQQDPQFRNLILTKLLTGTDDVTKRFKSTFDEYIKRLNRDYNVAYNSHYMQNQAARVALPVTASNQIFDRGLFKKGGKLSVLKEVVKQNQREKESNRKASSDFHKRTSKELARQLGALDKEQLMLLKSIFS